jgi:hypothetical protein
MDNSNRVVTVVVSLIILLMILKMMMYVSRNAEDTSHTAVIILNIKDSNNYDAETKKTLRETFFNLVLLKELLDNGSKESQDAIMPSIMLSLKKLIVKIQPILDYEKDIEMTMRHSTMKLKKDGMGNICVGSPKYFMCFNPNSQEIYPYVNDMLVVFHTLRMKSLRETSFPNVEKLLNTMMSNIFMCEVGNNFSVDYKSDKTEDVLLTKIFNSKLDVDIQSMLMMIIFFMGKNPMLRGIQNMSNNGVFIVSDSLKPYIQQFYPAKLKGNYVTYQQMKHALFNICSYKYTAEGFANVVKDAEKRKVKKAFIDANMAESLCKASV